jgi:predicted nucleic acid-binding protein
VGGLMYLLDTNIILEFLLGQDRADEVEKLFKVAEKDMLYISDFSVFSIGIIFFRKKQAELFARFIQEFVLESDILVVELQKSELKNLHYISQRFNLDFDDAYQYAIAEYYNLEIVSFNSDFDRTEKGRKEPKDLIK